MAMKPRTRRTRLNPPRNWSGPRPSSSSDPRSPRRRRPIGPTRPPEPEAPSAGLEAILEDFTESWGRGERPRAEGYLEFLAPEDSAELIYHEYCLTEASDLAPDPAEFLRRFPEHADSLGRLFQLHGALSASTLRGWAEPADLPSAGDEIGPYRLVRELGRGAFARVFLAEQVDLDHRLVVLKVATRASAEPRLLARARHTHIVEVLRHASTDDDALHLVCMPFLGGSTLASVLEARRKIGKRARSGRDLLADLDRVSAPEYPSARLTRPARETIAGLSHSKALAWIVARLAEALDHAHHRGVAHGDLKPSNILLTAEGSPMLFDFNLAVDWHEVDPSGVSADLGGTLAYMAPERLLALARGGSGPLPKAADLHRADLYALGLVLLEAITGQAPETPRQRVKDPRNLAGSLAEARRSLPGSLRRRGRRAIPPALRSILGKCLAPDPADRYARGNELAEDLDRWQADRPLVIAEEPRGSDLARRARRRRPVLIGVGLTLASAVAMAVGASIVLQGTKRDQNLVKYSMVYARADSGAFGVRRFGQWQPEEQGDPVNLAARQLERYDVLSDPEWRSRDDIQEMPDNKREELEAWLFEQILRYAIALGDRPDSPNDWRRALGLLDRTIARGASSALLAERAALQAKLKLPEPPPLLADAPRLPRWMDDYLAGVVAEPLHAREALDHYHDALRERPGLFWAHYRAATVACRIDDYPVAAQQLRHCVDESPTNPVLRIQLAACLFKLEQETPFLERDRTLSTAIEECDRAIALDPDFAEAHRTRAMICQVSGQDEGVRNDIRRFALLTRSRGSADGLMIRLMTQFHYGSNYKSDPAIVVNLTGQALAARPGDLDTRAILAAGLAQNERIGDALAEYDRVFDAGPDHLRARYGRATQLYKTDRAAAILEFASLINHPRFEELFREEPAAIRAFHYVATDLLNRGKLTEALEIAHRSLAHVNRSRSLQREMIKARWKTLNQTPMSPRGETYYLLARIHAASGDDGQIDQVVDYLDRTFTLVAKLRNRWYANDRRFDDLRARIHERMVDRKIDH